MGFFGPGRVVVAAALLVVGKRENESIGSDAVVSQGCSSCKEYFYSPRCQNEEACRRHRCLCIFSCCPVAPIQLVLCFQRGEVVNYDHQSGSLKKTEQPGTAMISNQRCRWLRASEAGVSPPSPRPGAAAEGT